MARRYDHGARVGPYRVEQVLGQGSHGTFYQALEDGNPNKPAFLKGYNSPSPRVAWYSAYLAHQEALWRRIGQSPAAPFTYRALRLFEHERQYFQALEFLGGIDVEKALEKDVGSREARLIWARAFTAGLAALHEAGIVHCDLKPANVYLEPDPALRAGHVLRIIDFDWSVVAGEPAPWHGAKDYVGTLGYASPEHLRGEVPSAPSDVFTAAIIVIELLGGRHPFPGESLAEYRDAVLRGAEPGRLIARGPASGEPVEAALRRALALEPEGRPTARQLNEVLNGR